MEEALDNGDLTWDGLARNVEFLQMGADIKLFLGRYWRQAQSYSGYSDEYDSDFDYDSDSDDYMSEDDATLADSDEDGICLADDEDDDMSIIKAKALARDPPRGRQRTTRRLGHSTSDPVISHHAAQAGPSAFRRNNSK